MNEWKSDTPKYSLFANNGLNCNGLVGQLAALLNLKIPDTAGKSLPWNFIKELKDAQGL